jgi:hypothetical protein
MRNACLESFLTDARLLIEFLAGRPDGSNSNKRRRNKHDFQPESLGHAQWQLSSPRIFDGYLERIEKHLSHRSLERVNSPDPQTWPVEQIATRLLAEYGNFADLLCEEGEEQCSSAIRSGVIEGLAIMTSPNPRFKVSTV